MQENHVIVESGEIEENSEQFEFLGRMKPVLKRTYMHNNENVVLTLKSMEILLGHNTKIYVPFNVVREMFKIPPSQEQELVKILFKNVKTGAEIDSQALLASLRNIKTRDPAVSKSSPKLKRNKSLPPVLSPTKKSPPKQESRKPIETSYLSNQKEHMITINFPTIEYLNP